MREILGDGRGSFDECGEWMGLHVCGKLEAQGKDGRGLKEKGHGGRAMEIETLKFRYMNVQCGVREDSSSGGSFLPEGTVRHAWR